MNDTAPPVKKSLQEALDEALDGEPPSAEEGLLNLIDRIIVGTPMYGLRVFEGGGRTVIAPRQDLPAVRPRKPIVT